MKKETKKKKNRRLIYSSKSTMVVYFTLRFIVLCALVLAILGKRWENVFTCALVLVLLFMPSIIERRLKIQLPSTLEIIIMLFIFAAEILGEIRAYYVRFTFWDTMLHTINGFLCAGFGFGLVELLNRNKKIELNLSPFYLAFVAFCFSMTVGVLWEFFEFGVDVFFLRDMQKDTILHVISTVKLDPTGGNTPFVIKGINDMSVNGASLGLGGYLDIGLYDTMKDLLVNFIGALVFSVIGFFSARKNADNPFTRNLVPTIAKEEEE